MNRFASIFSRALGAVASLLIVASAMADVNSGPGFYIGAGVGGYHTAEDFKATSEADKHSLKSKDFGTLGYGGLLGYKFNEYVRADLNGQYRRFYFRKKLIQNGVELASFTERIHSYSVFMNGYLDLPTPTVYTPYVTAGAGYVYNDPVRKLRSITKRSDYTTSGKKTSDFAWNAGAGIRMKFYKSIDLDIGYKYIDLGKIDINNTKDAVGRAIDGLFAQKLRIHQLMLNVIYNF